MLKQKQFKNPENSWFRVRKHQTAVWINSPQTFWKTPSPFDIGFVQCSCAGRNTGHQCLMGGALSMIKGWERSGDEAHNWIHNAEEKTKINFYPLLRNFVQMHHLRETELGALKAFLLGRGGIQLLIVKAKSQLLSVARSKWFKPLLFAVFLRIIVFEKPSNILSEKRV